MQKLLEKFTLHISESLAAAVRMRAAAFSSMNAYLTHCVQADVALAGGCHACADRRLAERVRGLVQNGGAEAEVMGRMLFDVVEDAPVPACQKTQVG